MIAESIVVQNFGLDLSDVRGLAGLGSWLAPLLWRSIGPYFVEC
jgi:hypothetical protein